jgi:hypothetical protein
MANEALPCVVCGKQLRNVDETSTNQPYEGLAFISHGHYGGTVFDPMDGRYLELTICDECLVRLAGEGKVLLGQDRKLVTIPGPAALHGIPTVVGTTPVQRMLVPWNPSAEEETDAVHLSSWEEVEEARELGFIIDSRFSEEELQEMFEQREE